MGSLLGEATLSFSLFPVLLIGVNSKRKAFAPIGANSFPLRVAPFLGRLRPPGKQSGSHENCLPEKDGGVSIHIKNTWSQPHIHGCEITSRYTLQLASYGEHKKSWKIFIKAI